MGANVPYLVTVLKAVDETIEVHALHEVEAREIAERRPGVIKVESVELIEPGDRGSYGWPREEVD